jgi:hypothetical protein
LGLSTRLSTRLLATLLLPLTLAACLDSEDGRTTAFVVDGSDANQPFPSNYRTELLAFMHTYLNNPVGVHDASMADPVQRTIGGRVRYVSCLRFAEPQSDGSYREPRERAIVFVGGRLDRVLDRAQAQDACSGVAYAPFPDLEKMSR